MSYRRYKRTDPRRYITRARLAAAGHPEAPAMLCLAIIAVTWTLMGVGVLAGVARGDDTLVHAMAPTWLRVTWWVFPAALALYALVTGRHTTITVAVLAIAPTIRLASYLIAWVSYLIPGVPEGLATAWYAAAFHGVMLGLVVLAAMLTRTEKVPPRTEGTL